MTSRTRPTRSARALTGLVLAGLALTACGDGAVRLGAAATIGDTRITEEQLQGLVEDSLSDPKVGEAITDRAAYQRRVLTRVIDAAVLELALADLDVDVTEGAVDKRFEAFIASTPNQSLAELEQQALGAQIAPRDLRPYVRNLVLEEALGDALTADVQVPQSTLARLYADNPTYEKVRSAHILVPTREQAATILAQVKADPTRFAALAKQFSTDTSNKDQGGDLGLVGRGSFVEAFEEVVFSAPVNDPRLVQTQFGFHVVKVVERATTPIGEVLPELRRQALQEERTAATDEVLGKIRADLGIRVSPRFGTWDPEVGEVVPRDGELSRPEATEAPLDGIPGGVPGGAPTQ